MKSSEIVDLFICFSEKVAVYVTFYANHIPHQKLKISHNVLSESLTPILKARTFGDMRIALKMICSLFT